MSHTRGDGISSKLHFTLANLIESVDWPSDCRREIENLLGIVQSFRKHIEPARHKVLAHYDKITVLSDDALGGFPEGEDERLLEALERMCNLMHQAAFGEIFGDMVPYHPGDVLDFKKAIREALAFRKLFSSSKGEKLVKLVELLKEVDEKRL